LIPHDKIWKRPDEAYFEYVALAKTHSPEEIEFNGNYKHIRELRDLSTFALTMYAASGTVLYVQMNTLSKSPDGFLMDPGDPEELSAKIVPVELTFYGRSKVGLPDESLADRLNKKRGKFQKLPDKYWLLVHVGTGLKVDHQEVADKLHALSPKFLVFSIQELAHSPDTISRLVIYEPDAKFKDVNIGEAAAKLSKTKLPGTITQIWGRPSTT